MAVERVPIRDAAARLGVSPDTIRRRIKAGDLTGERVPTPQGHRWVVALPVTLDVPAAPDQGKPATIADPAKTQPGGEVAPGADVAELATLRERVAGLERLGAELATDRDAWRERAGQDADAARELRILLGRAQELPRALAPGDGGISPKLGDIAPPDQAPAPGPWQRLRRRLRGE